MLQAFASWLLGWGKTIIIALANLLVDVVNAAIVALVAVVTTVANLFPAGDPAPDPGSAPAGDLFTQVVGAMNWVFPMQYLVTVATFVSVSVLAYVVIAPLARWFKLVR